MLVVFLVFCRRPESMHAYVCFVLLLLPLLRSLSSSPSSSRAPKNPQQKKKKPQQLTHHAALDHVHGRPDRHREEARSKARQQVRHDVVLEVSTSQ
jgi:hypothetical protein